MILFCHTSNLYQKPAVYFIAVVIIFGLIVKPLNIRLYMDPSQKWITGSRPTVCQLPFGKCVWKYVAQKHNIS